VWVEWLILSEMFFQLIIVCPKEKAPSPERWGF
jgi:hypothetical protein